MAMWLYQTDQQQWPPLDLAGRASPKPGDRVVFFYAPSGGIEPGFYGWAIVLDWHEDQRGM